MIQVDLQFQTTAGGPTQGSMQKLEAVPRIGETILTGTGAFIVVDVHWMPNGHPKVIAQPKAG